MDPVCDDMDIEMEYSNVGDHVPAAERKNRMIKEMFRVRFHQTGYTTMPHVMIVSLCEYGTKMLNMFPARHGISDYYSPAVIVTGRELDYEKHCACEFSTYVQAGQDTNPRNTPTK